MSLCSNSVQSIDHNISQNSKRAQQDSAECSINTNPTALTLNANTEEMWDIQTSAFVRQPNSFQTTLM